MVYGLKALKACSHFCAATGISIYIFFFSILSPWALKIQRPEGTAYDRQTGRFVERKGEQRR